LSWLGITGSSIADGYTIRTAILDCIGRLEHDYCSFDGDDVPAKRYQWGARVLLGFSHGGKCAPIRRSIFLQELSLLTAVAPAVTATGITGDNSATWTPTINVAVPGGTAAGIYSGTITQSVS
jgi:hypothetical protein